MLREEPPTPISLRPDLPRGVDGLIRAMMVKDSDKRLQKAVDVVQELRLVLENPNDASRYGGGGSVPVWVWLLIAVVVLAGGGWAVWAFVLAA